MLSITNLSKSYRGKKHQTVKALDQVNLSLNKGMFGLLGANGAGKSSLMRTIATLQQPDTGSITFDGCDVLAHPEVMRQNLGYLPQDFGVYKNASAYELLTYLAKLKGVSSTRMRNTQIDTLLEQVNLAEFKHLSVCKFSGGMKQRFGIAQALLAEPKVVIVDEPTAGLDPEERNRFHNLLYEISSDKVVLLSTHIVEDVRDLCPNMAIMVKGSVITQSSPQHLIDNMSGAVWQTKANKAEVDLLSQTHQVISQKLSAGEMTVHIYSEQDPGPNFLPTPPSLENAYFAAVHRFLSLGQGADHV